VLTESDFDTTKRLLTEAAELLKEYSEENERLREELRRLRKPSLKQCLIRWIDPEPEGGNV
jgi:hypothetical protein